MKNRAERRPHEQRGSAARRARRPPCSQARRSARTTRRVAKSTRLHGRQATARSALYRYAVVFTLVLFIVGFSLLLPRTFFTFGNFRTIVSSQAVLMILALGLTLPLTTGEFDLSIGSMLGCAAVLTAFFTGQFHLAPGGSSSSRPCSSAFSPARLNALFVVRIGVNAFIGTLGVSTMLTGLTLAVSDGQILNTVPQPLVDFVQHQVFGLAVPVYVAFALAIALWRLYEHTPLGRHLFFVGEGREAARLVGLAGRSIALRRVRRVGRNQRYRRHLHGRPAGRCRSFGRSEFPAARLRGRVSRSDDHQARTLQRLGHGRRALSACDRRDRPRTSRHLLVGAGNVQRRGAC